MPHLIKKLDKRNLLPTPPKYVVDQLQYLTIMGSDAYGVSSGSSDIDLYGWCIPNKDIIFPHVAGNIIGFGKQQKKFNQYESHHIKDPSNDKQYDISIYNIIRYFQLVMDNNPNMLDSLFTPRRCILHSTQISEHVRENRKLFLNKKSWHTYKGYAYSQIHKMKIKNPEIGSKRYEDVQKHGYDTKFAYHCVRLINQIEQILIEGDLDLERNREQLKSIRRAEWIEGEIIEYFNSKEKELEKLYITSNAIPHSPPEGEIKKILLECLEMHFGCLDNIIKKENDNSNLINELEELINRYK